MRAILLIAVIGMLSGMPRMSTATPLNDLGSNYLDPDEAIDTKDGFPGFSATCFAANPTAFEDDCLFRTAGPIVINIPVTRCVGDVDRLLGESEPQHNPLIQKFAVLRISAFDVDLAEVDSIYLNDKPVKGKLVGNNCIWSERQYEVPIGDILFPEQGTDGQAPTPRNNVVRIVIDTASPQPEYCTAIDWVAIEIKVASPLVCIHGANSPIAGARFNPEWRPNFTALYGLPVDESYNQGQELNYIETNATAVRNMHQALQALSNKYFELSQATLVCDLASLKYGGLFDLNQDWQLNRESSYLMYDGTTARIVPPDKSLRRKLMQAMELTYVTVSAPIRFRWYEIHGDWVFTIAPLAPGYGLPVK